MKAQSKLFFSNLFFPRGAAIFTPFASGKNTHCEINKIFTDKVLTNGDNINNIYTIRGTEINSAFLKTKG